MAKVLDEPTDDPGACHQARCFAGIASSARPSSEGGIARSRALAVFRLITNSNFVSELPELLVC